MENVTITLKGRDLYSKLRVGTEEFQYDDKSKMAGKSYFRCFFGTKAFVISPEVATAINNAEVAEINLEKTEREVEVDGMLTKVEGWQYAGHLTYKQALAITKSEGQLLQLESSFLVRVAADKELTAA